jgi:ribosome-interacting GTPase 1
VGLSFTQTFTVLNKIDLPGAEDRIALLKEFCPLEFREFRISAEHGTGLEELRNAIFAALNVVRVYTKLPTKKEADYDKPFTLKRGGTLLDVAELVHRDLAATFKYARVWGSSVLTPGTQMKADYVVQDKDVVEIHA